MIKDLPNQIPVFPLTGALLLPQGMLPLNIFEPRYLAMVDHALKTDRIIGMIQPRQADSDSLYDIGCAGRIVHFEETDDGRYLINLKGLSRFTVQSVNDDPGGFKIASTSWTGFEKDLVPEECLDIDREKLIDLLQHYFELHELQCDWSAIKDAPENKLMTCLAMVCPFEPQEKQALLEAKTCPARAELFIAMLDMAVKSGQATDAKH